MAQIVNVRNVKFTLKENGRLYARGNGYLSSTVDKDKILLSCDEDKEIQLCLKEIAYNKEANCLSLYDTRDQGYDIFIHDDIFYAGLSFVQSNTCQNIGMIVSFITVSVLCRCIAMHCL